MDRVGLIEGPSLVEAVQQKTVTAAWARTDWAGTGEHLQAPAMPATDEVDDSKHAEEANDAGERPRKDESNNQQRNDDFKNHDVLLSEVVRL